MKPMRINFSGHSTSRMFFLLWCLILILLQVLIISERVHGEEGLAVRIHDLKKQLAHCGTDSACYQRLGDEIGKLTTKAFENCSDIECIERVKSMLLTDIDTSQPDRRPPTEEKTLEASTKPEVKRDGDGASQVPPKKSLAGKIKEIQMLSTSINERLLKAANQEPGVWAWPLQPEPSPAPRSPLPDCNWLNSTSLKILSLLEELHSAGSQMQTPNVHYASLLFCREVSIVFSGKGSVNREDDAHFKYHINGRTPACLLESFALAAASNNVLGFNWSLWSENCLISRKTTTAVANGKIVVGSKDGRMSWAAVDRFKVLDGPAIGMNATQLTHEIPYLPTRYAGLLKLPRVAFYSSAVGPAGTWRSPAVSDWPWAEFSPNVLVSALEKGHLVLRSKPSTYSGSETDPEPMTWFVKIIFKPLDPDLKGHDQVQAGGISLWGSKTSHGGVLIATGKNVFCEGHPVAKEGDPVLCFVHGLTRVSRDESTGVYIGDKTVAFAGAKADCGAKILDGSTSVVVHLGNP